MITLIIPRFDPSNPKTCIENMAEAAKGVSTPYLAFIHSDVEIYNDEWGFWVDRHFKLHPKCGLIGFGGALALGSPDIYKTPYNLMQLLRYNYYSQQSDHEIHGYLLTKPLQVAVLDGFAMIFRREAYEAMGGWEDAIKNGLTFHCYDTWACCRMTELGWEVWVIPIYCWHRGGETSTSDAYNNWLASKGTADHIVHESAHRVIYDRFRNVLPLRIKP